MDVLQHNTSQLFFMAHLSDRERERERERERQRETDRLRDRETETNRQTDRQRDRHTDIQRETDREIERERQTDIHRQTDSQTDRHNRKTHKKTILYIKSVRQHHYFKHSAQIDTDSQRQSFFLFVFSHAYSPHCSRDLECPGLYLRARAPVT